MYESDHVLSWPEPSTAVLALVGEHDQSSVPILLQQAQSTHGRCTQLVIDLTETTFIDSGTLNALVYVERRMAKLGARVSIVLGDASPVSRVLEITRLDERFELLDRVPVDGGLPSPERSNHVGMTRRDEDDEHARHDPSEAPGEAPEQHDGEPGSDGNYVGTHRSWLSPAGADEQEDEAAERAARAVEPGVPRE